MLFEPKYPRDAFENKAEGVCRVSFDVSLNHFGSPQNIQILECSVKGIFEESCIKAVSRWKFKSVNSLNTDESAIGLITTCRYTLTKL